MSVRWILAYGRGGDTEVDPPKSDEEIVILGFEQCPGGEDGFDETVITFAHAGADDLLGWDVVEMAAVALYHKECPAPRMTSWPFLPTASKRYYVDRVQTVLASVMEQRAERRTEEASR